MVMLKIIKDNIRYIQNAFYQSKLYTSLIVFLNVLVSSMPAVKVLAIGKLIDDATKWGESGTQLIVNDACRVLLIYLLEYSLASIQSYLNYKFFVQLNNKMEDRFFSRLSKIKYAVLEDNDCNDLIYQVKDGIEKKFAAGFAKILEFVGFAVSVGSILFLVLTKSIWTGLVLIIVFLCLVPLYRKIGEDNYEAYAESNKEFRQAQNYRRILSDREYANEREVFGYSAFFNQKWKQRYESAIKKELRASKSNHIKILVVTACVTVLTTLLSGILLPMLLNGSLTVGVYVVIVTQLYNLVHFMSWNFSYIIDELAENQLYLADYDAFLKLDIVNQEEKEKKKLIGEICIRMENLFFKYPGCEDYVLKDFSYKFIEGKHYAIVGKNGAGKTTLVKLLLGLYDDYEGRILINDIDIREFSQAELKEIFSTVFQDYAKYAMTVNENILFEQTGDTVKEDQVKQVLKQLNVFEEIQELKKGMDTTLGKIEEDGVDFSGGQWQKIAIARGAVSDACVYILDEPSSSLDPISEKHLYELYNQIFETKTTILITHRLGNTKEQDEILVLEDGCLVEYGHHRMLMEKKAVYYDMYQKQRSWYHEAEN